MTGRTRTLREGGRDTGGDDHRPRLTRALRYDQPLAPPLTVELARDVPLELGRGTAPPRRHIAAGRIVYRLDTDDEWMSSSHASVAFDGGAWTIRDAGSKNGTRVDDRAIGPTPTPLIDGARVELGNAMFVFRAAVAQAGPAAGPTGSGDDAPPHALRTARVDLAAAFARLRRVAGGAISVLIGGDSGTGKELVARAVHELSGRTGAFVAVNCGALPEALVESQLFGYVKGAFSGALADAEGLVRAAAGGTLFLDEIAELHEPAQVALLRVLQEREVMPVGATKRVPVDLRVVAATHRNLRERMDSGAFREDLYGRLAGYTLELPSLRDRLEDLGLVVARALTTIDADRAPRVRFTHETGRALFAHTWPRNMRQLHHALELALTVADGDEVRVDHLPAEITAPPAPPQPTTPAPAQPVGDQRAAIVAALRDHAGNVSAAARALGYSRSHLNRLLKQHRIEPASYRP